MNCECCNGEARKFGRFKNQNRIVQRFQCVRCGTTFSESQPLEGLRLDYDKAVQIVKLLTEGIGIRACARLTDCHIHTVLEVLRVIGEKCERLLDKRVRGLSVAACQIDELWSYVARKQRNKKVWDAESGDFYTFLALDVKI